MSENPTVSCYDMHSNAYDAYQSAVIPHYQDVLDMVAKTCGRYLEQNSKLIDLGCGTGNASLAILGKTPAKIFLIDGSGRMVDLARKKISSAAKDAIIGFKAADISKDGWEDGLEEDGYDAIVSTLVLEHLPFDRYRAVLEKCHKVIKPNGWLIAVEGYEEKGSDMIQWFSEEIEEQKSRLDPKMVSLVAGLRDEKEVHYYCGKAQKEAWWREAGFTQVQVLWQYLCIALMIGRKNINGSFEVKVKSKSKREPK